MNKCKHCDKETSNPKFCNKSCSAKFNNSGKNRHGTIMGNCLFCSKKLNRSDKKFCTKQCYLDNVKLSTSIRFDNGSVPSSPIQRRILIERFGEVCSLCPQSGTHNGLPLILQVDHVDGNSDNHMPENLRLVCPNCHTQLPTSTDRSKKFHSRNLIGHRRTSV